MERKTDSFRSFSCETVINESGDSERGFPVESIDAILPILIKRLLLGINSI